LLGLALSEQIGFAAAVSDRRGSPVSEQRSQPSAAWLPKETLKERGNATGQRAWPATYCAGPPETEEITMSVERQPECRDEKDPCKFDPSTEIGKEFALQPSLRLPYPFATKRHISRCMQELSEKRIYYLLFRARRASIIVTAPGAFGASNASKSQQKQMAKGRMAMKCGKPLNKRQSPY